MYKMKIGILGCSSIAKRCVIPAIKKIPDLKLEGVASRDIDKAIRWSTEYYTNPYTYDELLASDIDIIYVSLPPGLHYKWGKKVLLSGKHLLMEKTFTSTHSESEELFRIADQNSLKCMEALMYEFHPIQDKIDILSKEIGGIKHINASFGFPYFSDKKDIRYNKNIGGGSILDSLIYPLSFTWRILGNNIKDYSKHFIETNVVERGTICLRYDDAIANINFGYGQAYQNEITIIGYDKIIKAERVFSRPPDNKNPIHIIQNNELTSIQVESSDHFENMIRYFIQTDSLLEKQANTLLRLKFMDEIRK